jgi:XTP/dITP diphosphohydrolase
MKPSICEDIGLFIPSLEGFPGPYLSYIEKTIKLEGLLQLLSDKENREAFWEYSVGFCIPSENPVVFTAFQYGEITTAPQGKSEWIDKIFRLNGERETIAQSYEQDTFKRNNEHYLELIDYINNKIT